MEKCHYVICDLDGCLSDDRHRRELLPKKENPKQEDFDAYHSLCGQDNFVTSTWERVQDALNRNPNSLLILATARPDRREFRELTQQWMFRHLPSCQYILLMRPAESQEPSAIVKRNSLDEYFMAKEPLNLLDGWRSVEAAFDDVQENLDAYPIIFTRKYLIDISSLPKQDGASFQIVGLPRRELAKSVPDILETMAATFRQRHELYGDSYLTFGKVCAALWPDGIHLSTEEEYNRHGIIVQIIGKLVRYTGLPAGHEDSAHDLAVYAAMLESLTEEQK